MSHVDLGIGLVLLVGAAFGAWKGLLRQVVGALAVAAGVVVPYLFAGVAATNTQGLLNAPFAVTFVLWCVVLALAGYVGVRVLFFFPVRAIENGRDGQPNVLGWMNRVAGAALGAAKFGVYFWVAFSLLSMVVPRIASKAQAARLEESFTYRVATDHNVFGPALEDELASLEKVLHEIAAGKKKLTPAVDAIAKDERIRAIAKDESLRKALREGDVTALGRSTDVLGLVFDKDAMKKIEAAAGELRSVPKATRGALEGVHAGSK